MKAAVDGADVIVYFGHGNGYPNPYTVGTEYTDRVNGWGLNRTTTNGDSDNWSSTMVYCGEKALLGTLSSGDGAAQKQYCGGTSSGGITPAADFTMIYGQAHYAPGFGERYTQSTPLTTLTEAQQRVRNYSTPILQLGGTFIATAYGDADDITERVLTQTDRAFADIFADGQGWSPSTAVSMAHPDVGGSQVWSGTLRQQKGRPEIERHDAIPRRCADAAEGRPLHDGRRVDQNVQPAKVRRHSPDQVSGRLGRSQVSRKGLRTSAQGANLGGCLFRAGGRLVVVQRDIAPPPRERQREGASHTSPCPGHQCSPSRDVHCSGHPTCGHGRPRRASRSWCRATTCSTDRTRSSTTRAR